MAEDCSRKSYRSPFGVTAEDEGADSVRVCIVLPGLVKKFASSKAKNAVVDVQFNTRSLEVKVEDLATKQSGVKKSENYRYVVKRLPDDVVKEGCRYSVEKDKLVLHLQKAVPRSWAAELDQSGLETDRPEDAADAM